MNFFDFYFYVFKLYTYKKIFVNEKYIGVKLQVLISLKDKK